MLNLFTLTKSIANEIDRHHRHVIHEGNYSNIIQMLTETTTHMYVHAYISSFTWRNRLNDGCIFSVHFLHFPKIFSNIDGSYKLFLFLDGTKAFLPVS